MTLKDTSGRKLILLFFLLTGVGYSTAQLYVPIDTANATERVSKADEYRKMTTGFLSDLKKKYSGKEKSYVVKHFTEQSTDFGKDLESGTYLFDKRYDNLIDSVVTLLRKHNEIIPGDLKFYISRDLSLNSACFGDRIFVINIGSFYFLDNENELAAMLAHEISHLILSHEIKTLQSHYQVEHIDSKSTLSEVKSARYSRGTLALEKFKNIMYADKALNRIQENEADSLGYILYKNSGFKPYDYINSYRLMALYDSITPVGVKEGTYRKLFSFQDFPFKESWLKKEDFSAYDYSGYKPRLNEDSISSHPETDFRINRLQRFFPELKDSVAPSVPTKNFASIQTISDFERVPSLIINEDFGRAIYLCLLKLQEDDNDAYYMNFLGELFGKICDARKAYKLNRYMEIVDPSSQSQSYQQFLTFMWNLSMSDLKAISAHLIKKPA